MAILRRNFLGLPLIFWLIAVLIIGALVTLVLVGGIINLINGGGYNNPIICSQSSGCSFWHPVLYSALLLLLLLTGFAYTTLLERKLVAYFQQRLGPNRVGPAGFLQPLADGVKLIFKEDVVPYKVDKVIYYMAPMLKAIPILIVVTVIPLGPPITIPWFDGNWYRIPLGIADPGVGILWLLAITSIGTYGVVLAGWASNNKYAMLGGLRATAQMISYELSLGLALVVPVLIVGSMSVGDIIEAQGGLFTNWLVFQNPLAAGILIVALIAETNRAPFDLPEAEQELTAGYMTEYSGMKFALFMMAEYLGMIAVSMIAAATFFGGYSSGFGLEEGVPIIGPLVFIGKVVLFLAGFVWLRATLPRIRYDRLMTFGWKVMLPLSLLSIAWTAIALVVGDTFGPFGYAIASGVMVVLVLGSLYLLFMRSGSEEEEDDDIESDPVVTGDRRSLAYAGLQVIGGLVAAPIILYNNTLKVLDRLANLAEEPSSETAIEEVPPSKSGGD